MSDELADHVLVLVADVSDQDLQALGDTVLGCTLRRIGAAAGSPAADDEAVAAFQDSL
jgi:hypothetical protein